MREMCRTGCWMKGDDHGNDFPTCHCQTLKKLFYKHSSEGLQINTGRSSWWSNATTLSTSCDWTWDLTAAAVSQCTEYLQPGGDRYSSGLMHMALERTIVQLSHMGCNVLQCFGFQFAVTSGVFWRMYSSSSSRWITPEHTLFIASKYIHSTV